MLWILAWPKCSVDQSEAWNELTNFYTLNIFLFVLAFSRTVTATLASLLLFKTRDLSCIFSDGGIHKGIDIVCSDYGIINAPFSGNFGGPVGRTVRDSVQYDGVKLYNKGIYHNDFHEK